MAEDPIVAGEIGFSAEERVQIRKWVRILDKQLELSDVVEIKRIAQSGKVMKGVLIFLAWFGGAVTGALVLLNAVKQFMGKGG